MENNVFETGDLKEYFLELKILNLAMINYFTLAY